MALSKRQRLRSDSLLFICTLRNHKQTYLLWSKSTNSVAESAAAWRYLMCYANWFHSARARDLCGEEKEKENRNVQIPGEGVAPTSQLWQRKRATFSLLIFSNGANRSPISCVCSLSGKLASSLFSMWHSLCCHPLALSAYMTGLELPRLHRSKRVCV